jgi:hypothetical protein
LNVSPRGVILQPPAGAGRMGLQQDNDGCRRLHGP